MNSDHLTQPTGTAESLAPVSGVSAGIADLRWKLRTMPRRLRDWLRKRLIRGVVMLSGDCNLIAHAKRELAPSLKEGGDGPNRWMADDLIELLAVFSAQGHSGFSASYATSAVEKLMRFEPLGPLTGDDDEWNEVGDGVFQNRRCSHVFKQADRFNGQAYDIEARIFREPSGACFTGRDSFVPITFPYTPKREYVDVPASA
jgi:hypothetical protein